MRENDRKYVIASMNSSEKDRVEYISKNMSENGSFKFSSTQSNDYLEKLKARYLTYRNNWRNQPKRIINAKIDEYKIDYIPLCIDLEVAAVCDLACPHCYRQYIATPDKIMKADLVYKLIDQASDIGVPSMKFNWRGEPLLHPELPKFIKYAKEKGILETIINTNATMLNDKVILNILDSGLDILIYSFDGGTKKTYEKMRPGRFKENRFDQIYTNIKRFNELRLEKKSKFPRTKIQMVLTNDTFDEVDSFYKLFENIVDDVSLKQYTERGGTFGDVGKEMQEIILKKNIKKIDDDEVFMRDLDGEIYSSKKRLPCEQPFQRMLITYDGRVSMCCYDWGSMHPIGYVSNDTFKDDEKDYKDVLDKSQKKKKGFEMMNLELPPKFNSPERKIETISEIWNGYEIEKVRQLHLKKKVNDVTICKKCPFKETYEWQKI